MKTVFTSDVQAQCVNHVGLITLNRPKALNALSLAMVRELTHVLLAWQNDPQVYAAAMLLFRRLVEKKAPLKR